MFILVHQFIKRKKAHQSLRKAKCSTSIPDLVMMLIMIPSPVEVSRSEAEMNESLMILNAFSFDMFFGTCPAMFFRPTWLSRRGCSIAPAAPPARYLSWYDWIVINKLKQLIIVTNYSYYINNASNIWDIFHTTKINFWKNTDLFFSQWPTGS